MEYLAKLEALPISQWVLTDLWAHPLLLSAHSIGMGTVVGLVIVLDLRVLGYARGISLDVFERLMAVAWAGFALNAASGVLMFMAYATSLVANWTFDLKIALIIAGGLSLWLLWRAIRECRLPSGEAVFSRRAKTLAVISALFWVGAVVAGRYIAYTIAEGA